MMHRVLIDTNAYVQLLAGSTRIAAILARSEAVLLSAVVIGELLDGFRGGSQEERNREELARFRGKSRTEVAPITDATAEWFAMIKQQLRRKGKPIPTNDVWIAAACMERGAALVSIDRHFKEIEGLLRVVI
jgi:predicted nucleic acid-binding protein